MHVHILGIGGTFMVGVARLALALGYRVSGSDAALYPPMSTQLETMGIDLIEGYSKDCLDPAPDLVVIGNALSRGNEAVEAILERDLPYVSGPEWLERFVLPGRHVIAVAGTHGKTTVSSLVVWMLEHAGLEPGFLVGGVLENFGFSARLGDSRFFVIEADEYDTAFFDKRSKFVHYHPRTLIINNLEFDHADIFADLAAIQTQFHHLVRTMPATATIIHPAGDSVIADTLARGCWSTVRTVGEESATDADWRLGWTRALPVELFLSSKAHGEAAAVSPLLGDHNAWNVALAAAAVAEIGVTPSKALAALDSFANVKRRLELRGEFGGVRVFDDFAHHPTAIRETISALHAAKRKRLIAVLEPRSNTMRMGIHEASLGDALAGADQALVYVPEGLEWDLEAAMGRHDNTDTFADIEALLETLCADVQPGDEILIMSNGGFHKLHERLIERLDDNAD